MIDRVTARISSRFLSYGLPFLYLLTSIAFYLHTYDSAQVKITVVQMLGTVVIGFWYVTLMSDRDLRTGNPTRRPICVPLLAAHGVWVAFLFHMRLTAGPAWMSVSGEFFIFILP